ncbi:MAG: hypothetical protein JRG79_18840 [Deltaproteobacteria bacterium]|nr:hypothetical protein [Deltaproteobacteria bacterium]
MTHLDKGHFAKKHPSDQQLNTTIADKIKEHVSEDEITCAAAHGIAEALKISPAEVGSTVDLMEIRIVKCQLGLFGYIPQKRIVKPADDVPAPLQEAILKNLVNERLPCASSWQIAGDMGLRKMEVASACEALQIKVTPCQLGAF